LIFTCGNIEFIFIRALITYIGLITKILKFIMHDFISVDIE